MDGIQSDHRVHTSVELLILASAIFLIMLPVTMVVPVLKDLLRDRFGASIFQSHLFMVINMVGGVIAAPIGAVISDRLGRRGPVLIAALLSHVAILSLMAWATLRDPSLSLLLTLRFLDGAAHLTVLTSLMALAGDGAPGGQRGRTMGLIGGSLMFGTAFGTPLGGRLGEGNPALVFQLGAVLIFISLCLVAFLLRGNGKPSRGPGLSAALSLVRRNKSLLFPYAFSFVDRFCVGVIISSFIFYLRDFLDLKPGRIGGLLAIFLIPMSLLCYPMGKLSDRIGRMWPLCLGSIGFGLVMATYGWLSLPWLMVAMLLSGVLSAIMFPPNLALCSDWAPAGQRATAFAGFNMAGSLGFMCGPLFGAACLTYLQPRVGELAAYQTTFLLSGLAVVACVIVSLPWMRDLGGWPAAVAAPKESPNPSDASP